MTTKNHFAVYEHIRPDTGQVFYVGKGSPSRVRHRQRKGNPHHMHIMAYLERLGLEVEVSIVAANLPEDSANTLEKMRILMWRAAKVPIVNMTDGGEGVCGYIPTPEWRENMRSIMLGREFTPEWRDRLSRAAKSAHARPEVKTRHVEGVRVSAARPEFGAKISAIKKGNTVITTEQKIKISAALTGTKQGADSNAKRSAALTGVAKSDEHKKKISVGKSGKTFTEEHKAALRAVSATPETKARRRAAALAREARRRVMREQAQTA